MIETFWSGNRASILVGLLGAVALWLLLALTVLFVAGMSHCSQCDMTPFMLRGFGFSFLLALLFGLAVGLVAAGLRSILQPFLRAWTTTALLVLLALGSALLAVQPGFYALQFLEHRLDRWEDDAALTKLRDLCPDPPRHLAIIHDGLPRPLPRDTLVAEVRFEETDVKLLHTGGARAKVLRVIQGDPTLDRLSVERLQSTRCDKAFANGNRGMIVAIPKDLPRAGYQKVEAIFARREYGFRLHDGFQIQEWQRPYWLPKPQVAVPAGVPHGKAVTHAENGMASTSIDSGPAVVVSAPPTTVDARGPVDR